MSRVIKVRSGFKYASHSTFEASIAAAQKACKKAEEKCSLINGVVVTEYQFNGNKCIVSFENNLHLSVSPGKYSKKWEILDTKPNIGKFESSDTLLELPNGTQLVWNCDSVLDKFIGKKAAISPSDQRLFIYSENK